MKVTKLGLNPQLMAFGIVILLWTPRIIDYLQPTALKPPPNQHEAIVKQVIQTGEDLKRQIEDSMTSLKSFLSQQQQSQVSPITSTSPIPTASINNVPYRKGEGKALLQADAPPLAVINQIDALIAHNNFEDAYTTINQLQQQFPASSDVYYRALKALTMEIKWAMTLQERTLIMKKIMYSQDYLGLICEASEAYVSLYGSSDKHSQKTQTLYEIAKQSLKHVPCKSRPMPNFVQDEFLSRLSPFADFVSKLETFSFE